MAKVVIKDFLIQMGFDGAVVTKGLNKLEKDVKSFSKSFVGLAKSQQTNNSRLLKGINAVNAAKRKQLALDQKLGTQSNTVVIGGSRAGGGAKSGGLVGNAVGPSRKEMKRLQSQQRSSLALDDKKRMVIGAIQRKLDAIGAKYGDTDREIRKNAVSLSKNKEAAAKVVVEVKKITQEFRKVQGSVSKVGDARGLKKLNEQLKNVTASSARVTSNLDAQNRKMNAGKFAARGLSNSIKNLANSYVSIFAVGAGAAGAGRIGQELIASKAALLGASGSAKQAGDDFEFLQGTSQHLGVSLRESVAGYARVGAAARSAGLGVDVMRNTFLAAQEVSASFNLGASDSAGIFRAFSQILAKGKLSSEELLQLGERIPIAFDSAAKSMSMTTAELIKLVETGKLMSVDFLPSFAEEMRTFVNESGMLGAALNTSGTAMGRFKTAFENSVLASFDAGAEKGLSSFFNDLTFSLKKLRPMFVTVGKIMGAVFESLGLVIRAVTQLFGPLDMFGEKGADAAKSMNDELRETVSLIDTIIDAVQFLVGVVTIIPAMFERMDKAMGTMQTIDQQVKSGKLQTIDSGIFSRTPEPAQAKGKTTTNNNNITIQANDVFHVTDIVKDVLQGEFTLNYSGG